MSTFHLLVGNTQRCTNLRRRRRLSFFDSALTTLHYATRDQRGIRGGLHEASGSEPTLSTCVELLRLSKGDTTVMLLVHKSESERARLKKATFVPSHVMSTCDCLDHVFESSGQKPMTALASHCRVPLILLVEESVQVLDYHCEDETVPKYVAISHVRSQGLGSTEGNFLPLCQLVRLQNLVNNVVAAEFRPVPFWIDTACIPSSQPGKALTFELLAAAYRRAEIVLALDMDIEHALSTSATRDLETIQSSSWAKRLWTIREGALASRILFQFANTAVDFDVVLQQYSTDPIGLVVTWNASSTDLQEMSDERMRESDYLDVLWMLERDERVYLGRAPATAVVPSRESHKEALRTLLLKCYLSTSRYRLFLESRETQEIVALRRRLEDVYRGLTYKGLISEQRESIQGTLRRIADVRNALITDSVQPPLKIQPATRGQRHSKDPGDVSSSTITKSSSMKRHDYEGNSVATSGGTVLKGERFDGVDPFARFLDKFANDEGKDGHER